MKKVQIKQTAAERWRSCYDFAVSCLRYVISEFDKANQQLTVRPQLEEAISTAGALQGNAAALRSHRKAISRLKERAEYRGDRDSASVLTIAWCLLLPNPTHDAIQGACRGAVDRLDMGLGYDENGLLREDEAIRRFDAFVQQLSNSETYV